VADLVANCHGIEEMREELKGRNLTFTEIAKLVGENWQSLSQAEKQPYESQAQAIKDKYHIDLVEYKRTQQYKAYMAYLQEFKAKYALQLQGVFIVFILSRVATKPSHPRCEQGLTCSRVSG